MTEHTGASYAGIARAYAASVDTQPWNAFYERPAVLSLLPPVAGANVLDAGCGPGWYAETLLGLGASVTAVDLNADFVAITQERIGQRVDHQGGRRARVLQADLAEPLDFAADGEFDLVVCPLVMHYLKAWEPTLREFQRVLKPAGALVFSTHHPFMDWKLFDLPDYFALTLVHDDWGIGPVSFYHRSLTAICDALHAAGFSIDRLLEAQPTTDFLRADPAGYDRLMKNPWFLVVKATKSVAD